MSTHTPGPWNHGGGALVTPNGVTDRFVRAHTGIIAHCSGPLDQAVANAQLIAAAPELLQSLGILLRACKAGAYVGSRSDAVTQAEAVIRRATGSQS